ncbi:hypothetical protein FBY31_0190 [Arthrobacter sp. SLBN-100]|nr:hypothetical protein FBY31_0190 [Arthrobacter sp. SLBN-100]
MIWRRTVAVLPTLVRTTPSFSLQAVTLEAVAGLALLGTMAGGCGGTRGLIWILDRKTLCVLWCGPQNCPMYEAEKP